MIFLFFPLYLRERGPHAVRGVSGAPGERQTFPESLYSGAMTIAAAIYPVHQQYPGGIPRFSLEARVSAASPTRTFLKASSFGLVLSSYAVGTAAPSARRKTRHHLNSASSGNTPKKTNSVGVLLNFRVSSWSASYSSILHFSFCNLQWPGPGLPSGKNLKMRNFGGVLSNFAPALASPFAPGGSLSFPAYCLLSTAYSPPPLSATGEPAAPADGGPHPAGEGHPQQGGVPRAGMNVLPAEGPLLIGG